MPTAPPCAVSSVARAGWLLLLAVMVLVTALPAVGCRAPDPAPRVEAIAAPYRFSVAAWELAHLPPRIGGWINPADDAEARDTAPVELYFDLGRQLRAAEYHLARVCAGAASGDAASLEEAIDDIMRQRTALAPEVTAVIEAQITAVLLDLGMGNDHRSLTPPPGFVMEAPPGLLIVSPRESIRTLETITLKQQIGDPDREAIEAQVDALGVVSLVLDLGGIGTTYPAFVTDRGGLAFTVATALEEWLHQYLVFKPLGQRYAAYLLGLNRDHDVATLNETFAGIVSEEIRDLVLARFYGGRAAPAPRDPAAFDFDAAMRQTRRTVDTMLAAGEVDRAEAYMFQRRDYLEAQGYYLRKLNQAYFAFHGRYADAPSSVDPLGDELRAFRAEFGEISEFIAVVAALQSRDELHRLMAGG